MRVAAWIAASVLLLVAFFFVLAQLWPKHQAIQPEREPFESSCSLGGGIPARFVAGELRGRACLYPEYE